MKVSQLTCSTPHGVSVGDYIQIIPYRPWWKRLWRWLIRAKDPALEVAQVTNCTINVTPQ